MPGPIHILGRAGRAGSASGTLLLHASSTTLAEISAFGCVCRLGISGGSGFFEVQTPDGQKTRQSPVPAGPVTGHYSGTWEITATSLKDQLRWQPSAPSQDRAFSGAQFAQILADGCVVEVSMTVNGVTKTRSYTVPPANGEERPDITFIRAIVRAVVGSGFAAYPLDHWPLRYQAGGSASFGAVGTALAAPLELLVQDRGFGGSGARPVIREYAFDHTGGISLVVTQTIAGTWTPGQGVVQIDAYNQPVGGLSAVGRVFTNEADFPDPVRVDVLTPDGTPANPLQELAETLNADPGISYSRSQAGRQHKAQVDLRGAGLVRYGGGLQEALQQAITRATFRINKPSLAALEEGLEQQTSEILPVYPAFSIYDAISLDCAAAVEIEDCSTLSPSDGAWEGSAATSLSIVSGSVRCVSTTGSPREAVRRWSTADSKEPVLNSMRYLRVRVRSVGSANEAIKVRVWTGIPAGSNPWFARNLVDSTFVQRAWTITTGNDGQWVDRDLDLMAPEEMWDKTASSLTQRALPPYDGLEAWNEGNANLTAPYWGVIFLSRISFDLPTNSTIEIDSISLRRETDPQLAFFEYGGDFHFRAVTDGKLGLELKRIENGVAQQVRMSDFVSNVNRTYPLQTSPPLWRGWQAALITDDYPTDVGNDFYGPDSPWRWLGGGGVLYRSGAFERFNVAEGSILEAQPHATFVNWYPGCGDILGLDSGAHGGAILLRPWWILRSEVEGILLDLASAPAAGHGVHLERYDKRTEQAGAAVSDVRGYYRTGQPRMKYRNYWVVPDGPFEPNQITTVPRFSPALSHWRHRLSYRLIQQPESQPWNLQDDQGRFHRVNIHSGRVRYRRSHHAVPKPAWVVDRYVSLGSGDVEPRLALDYLGRIRTVWARDSGGWNTYEAVSDDGGETWSAEEVGFAGGKHPTIAVGTDGTLLRAAYVSGVLKGTSQGTGDPSPSPEFTFKDGNGDDLHVADMQFHLQQAHEGPSRWLLSVLIDGESSISDWWSADGARTWTRI